MVGPRAIVLPFAVPDAERGLGLGLAAVVHGFVRLGGEGLALAQLHGRRRDSEDDTIAPVEVLVPAIAWADLASRSPASGDVELVLTGAFEPPRDGDGMLHWIAYDPRSGETRASGEDPIDEPCAGRAVVAAFEHMSAGFGAQLGQTRELAELDWNTLESVLRAERCALVDPMRGAPHDPAAAVGHLERAVADAPAAHYPASRLAALALDLGAAGGTVGRAALRALARASADAPSNGDLLEANAALALRLGDPAAAETRAIAALGVASDHPRLWAIVSEARRAQGNVDGAYAAVMLGLLAAPVDPVLTTERGIVHAMRAETEAAMAAWSLVLERAPAFFPAFANLGALALGRSDTVLMQKLVDHALAIHAPHPDMLRRGVQLALAGEPEGTARAARVAALARRVATLVPDDAAARVILAQSLAQLGEHGAALEELSRVERTAKGTPAAAEAQRGLLALRDPDAARAIDRAMLAARNGPAADLASVATRAHELLGLHGVWTAAFAEAVAEQRMGHMDAAHAALRCVLELAPGCMPAHAELVGLCVRMGDGAGALRHAEALHAAEGDTPRALVLLARAKAAAGRHGEAWALAARILSLDPGNEEAKALCAAAPASRPSWIRRLLGPTKRR